MTETQQETQPEIQSERQSQALLQFFKAVGQPERVKILGLVANQAYSIPELAEVLDMKIIDIRRHVKQLRTVGLLKQDVVGFGYADKYRLDSQSLDTLNNLVIHNQEPEPLSDRVHAHYIAGQRLKSIPADPEERAIVLQWLADKFERGKRYTESEVYSVIKRHYHKQELLFRYLLDQKSIKCVGDIYWRSN